MVKVGLILNLGTSFPVLRPTENARRLQQTQLPYTSQKSMEINKSTVTGRITDSVSTKINVLNTATHQVGLQQAVVTTATKSTH